MVVKILLKNYTLLGTRDSKKNGGEGGDITARYFGGKSGGTDKNVEIIEIYRRQMFMEIRIRYMYFATII